MYEKNAQKQAKNTKNKDKITTQKTTEIIKKSTKNVKKTAKKTMKNNNKNASKTHKKCQETKYIFCKDSIGHAHKGLTNGIKTCPNSSTKVRRVGQKNVKKTTKK